MSTKEIPKPRRRKTAASSLEQIKTALFKSHGLVSVAAQMLGCDTAAIYKRIQRNPELKTIRDEAREELIDAAEQQLVRQVRMGAGWAVCFTLKTLGKKRGYVERQEVTGENGGPIRYGVLVVPEVAASEDEWLAEQQQPKPR